MMGCRLKPPTRIELSLALRAKSRQLRCRSLPIAKPPTRIELATYCSLGKTHWFPVQGNRSTDELQGHGRFASNAKRTDIERNSMRMYILPKQNGQTVEPQLRLAPKRKWNTCRCADKSLHWMCIIAERFAQFCIVFFFVHKHLNFD